ncbi:MAG: C69 family dipeptidase, partial [Myxococcota bacterium]
SETASRATLFAKNSDRQAGECQPLLQFPESSYPPDARVRCTHISISQVAETYRVLGHSPWWVWGFEHGVNEHAVAIGNQAVFSKEPIEEQPGLIGMDLVRLGLERGRTARESLEVIAGLIEAHGQGGAAFGLGAGGYHNSFMLAHAEEAWALETSNRHWAARRAGLESLSNHYSIGSDWEIGSRDLATFANRQGWWTAPGRINVAAAYRNPDVPARISEGRRRRSRELLESGRGHHDAETLKRLLRDHLEGGLAWQPGSTPDDERHFTLCAHSEPTHWTTASVVAELPSEPADPWPIWVSFATPCSGIFLPVYVDGVIPASLAQGGKHDSRDSAWWAFKRLQDKAGADSARHTLQLREAWSDFENRVELERVEVEQAAHARSQRGDRDAAAQLVTRFMDRTCARAIECANALSDRIA